VVLGCRNKDDSIVIDRDDKFLSSSGKIDLLRDLRTRKVMLHSLPSKLENM
jgi:hypothetical protein